LVTAKGAKSPDVMSLRQQQCMQFQFRFYEIFTKVMSVRHDEMEEIRA